MALGKFSNNLEINIGNLLGNGYIICNSPNSYYACGVASDSSIFISHINGRWVDSSPYARRDYCVHCGAPVSCRSNCEYCGCLY